jgi:hypothetical protein
MIPSFSSFPELITQDAKASSSRDTRREARPEKSRRDERELEPLRSEHRRKRDKKQLEFGQRHKNRSYIVDDEREHERQTKESRRKRERKEAERLVGGESKESRPEQGWYEGAKEEQGWFVDPIGDRGVSQYGDTSSRTVPRYGRDERECLTSWTTKLTSRWPDPRSSSGSATSAFERED